MKISFESCAKLMMFETIMIIEKGKGVNIIHVYAWDPLQERTGIFLSKQKKKARFSTTCENITFSMENISSIICPHRYLYDKLLFWFS